MALAGAPSITLAQSERVTEGPPPITFGRWQEVQRREFHIRYTTSFPSPVATGIAVNDLVQVTITMPTERVGAVPCVVLLHYWGATDDRFELDFADQLATRGIASVVVPLPYHLSRTPVGSKSGELAIQPDPQKLIETMVQSVQDIRRAVDMIVSRPEFDPKQIGITGTSLGAIVTGLAFAVEPRFSAAAFMLGGADLAHILWHSSRAVTQRDELRRKGFTEDRLRVALVDIEPLNYLKPSTRASYVVTARHDTVIPAPSSQALIRALGEPHTVTIDTGHYGGVLIQGSLKRSVVRFFESAFRGEKFAAPSKFAAPTIRLGLNYDIERGLQVAGGVDVWRPAPSSPIFAAALVTPKGFQGFVGVEVSRGLALGVSLQPRRMAVGGFWSVVF